MLIRQRKRSVFPTNPGLCGPFPGVSWLVFRRPASIIPGKRRQGTMLEQRQLFFQQHGLQQRFLTPPRFSARLEKGWVKMKRQPCLLKLYPLGRRHINCSYHIFSFMTPKFFARLKTDCSSLTSTWPTSVFCTRRRSAI